MLKIKSVLAGAYQAPECRAVTLDLESSVCLTGSSEGFGTIDPLGHGAIFELDGEEE